MRELQIQLNRSVDRAIEILDAFTLQRPALTLDEVTAATGLPKATVYRILYTMERRGLVFYDSTSARYRLGFKLLEYGGILTSTLDVLQECEELLDGLQRDTRQSVIMSMRQQCGMVYIYRREVTEGLKFSSFVGQRRPLLYGVLGWVMAAYLSEEELRNCIDEFNQQCTSSVAGAETAEAMHARLAQIRAEGVYIEFDETIAGVAGVGAPVFDALGRVNYGIAVLGPSVQMSETTADVQRRVQETAKAISRRLGYTGSYPQADRSN
ncbi:IclR family transcriptional regulator [Alicyclobacillus herbarius]|uniref:IclR family transcriptional regulator n=1 Tax=Alicyclobacillus herbarius TaxID=122960 RepID=UPI00041159BC|nr:IclR family transcriptional regulator [Alicyclobacillus herbarius]